MFLLWSHLLDWPIRVEIAPGDFATDGEFAGICYEVNNNTNNNPSDNNTNRKSKQIIQIILSIL